MFSYTSYTLPTYTPPPNLHFVCVFLHFLHTSNLHSHTHLTHFLTSLLTCLLTSLLPSLLTSLLPYFLTSLLTCLLTSLLPSLLTSLLPSFLTTFFLTSESSLAQPTSLFVPRKFFQTSFDDDKMLVFFGGEGGAANRQDFTLEVRLLRSWAVEVPFFDGRNLRKSYLRPQQLHF